MLSIIRKGKKSHNDDGRGSAIEDGVGNRKKKAYFKVEGVLLHHTREARSTTAGISSRNSHQKNICEDAVHFRWKTASYEDAVPLTNYKAHARVHTRHSL